MSLELIILIYALALAILVVEAFVPSGGILALVGGIGLVVSLYYSFTKYGALLGSAQSIIALILIPLVIYIGFRKMTLKKNLDTSEGFTSEKAGLDQLLNKEGIAHTNLRPSGTAVIEGKKIDVVTEGDMIDKDTQIKVIKVESNRVIVRIKS
ncbi:MAG: NfeD family protein [Candidatus Brocadiia bacterium]